MTKKKRKAIDKAVGAQAKVYEVMKDGKWYTIDQVTYLVGSPGEAGTSARIRDFRKAGLTVERTPTETPRVFQYRLAL